MTILDHLISTLDVDTPVRDIRLGVFHTAVLTRRCGLAASLPRDALRQTPPMVREPGQLLDWTAEALVGLARSEHLLEAAMGMATLNSLLEVDETACQELNASELILEKGRDRNVVVVGHFPFLPKVRDIARNLWVLEKNPREGDHPAEQAGEWIPQADVVAITGTTLTNHTLESLLPLCRPEAFVILLGDTAPLSPILFDYGITAISGTVADQPEVVLRHISQGATYRQIRGIRRLTLLKP
ncbi:MAG: DUF364 domain-containing protein [Kiritimatiellia bacterium]|jgi:uncharacterized protein (DUF4213/DUF364 family)|nr:DUF364 domain-containing protein [Kiritimatiellia bacterium]